MFLAGLLKALFYVFHLARLVWLANVEVYDVPDKELPTQAHFAHWQRKIIMAALGADTSLPHTFVIPDGNIYFFLKFSQENIFNCHACAKYVLQDGLFFSEGEHWSFLSALHSLEQYTIGITTLWELVRPNRISLQASLQKKQVSHFKKYRMCGYLQYCLNKYECMLHKCQLKSLKLSAVQSIQNIF